MFIPTTFLSKVVRVKKGFLLFATLFALNSAGSAHANAGCKEYLNDLSYPFFKKTPSSVAKENTRNFKNQNSTASLVLSKNARLKAFHMLKPGERFPKKASLHAVIFDRFGFRPNDFLNAQNKINTLSSSDSSAEKIPMGAEAFSPNSHLGNIESVARWMKEALTEVQSQNKDGRPLVVYARGALCEAAVYLAQHEPQLISSLVLENPVSGESHSTLPNWTKESFTVPTYIATGTHDPSYLQSNKQKLFDLSSSIKPQDGNRRVHYMDMPFAASDVFGPAQKESAKGLAHQEIDRFLNNHVLKKKYPDSDNTSPERFVEIAQNEGIGTRRFFGHTPRPTPQNEINAIRAGVLMWEQPVKAVSSVEEALSHIEKLNAVKEKPANGIINRPIFFISSNPKLKEISESKTLDEALSHLGTDPADMIREAAQNGNRFFWIDEAGNVHDYAPEKILSVPLEAVHLDDNKNGFVFNASGWTLPVIRGVITLEDAKKSHAYKTGRILFSGAMDRKGSLQTPGIAAEGFHFKKNQNLAGVLEKLRNMHRKGQSENATRFIDPFNIILMQRLYEAGLLETIELYNAQGELVAGGLNVKIDNVLSPETLFYPHKEEGPLAENAALSQTLDGVDYAKIIVTHMIDEAILAGHTKMDSQIVSSFTILFSPKYVRTDSEFLPFVRETNAGWEEQQRLAFEKRKRQSDYLASKLEARKPEIESLKNQIEETEASYTIARQRADELRINRDVKPEEKDNPEMVERIQVARDAKNEARKLERELNQLKAKLEVIEKEAHTLTEFEATNSLLTHAELSNLIFAANEKIEKSKAALTDAITNQEKLSEEYNQTLLELGGENPKIAELKLQLDRAISKCAGIRQGTEEARAKVENLEGILLARHNEKP